MQSLTNKHNKLILEKENNSFRIPTRSDILTRKIARKISETPF